MKIIHIVIGVLSGLLGATVAWLLVNAIPPHDMNPRAAQLLLTVCFSVFFSSVASWITRDP